MLVVEVVISDTLVNQVIDRDFVNSIESTIKEKFGITTKVVVMENKCETGTNRLWIRGYIQPECEFETEMTDQTYLKLLKTVGLAFEKRQRRFLQMEILTSVFFSGMKDSGLELGEVTEDPSKRFLITYQDNVACCCDTSEEVSNYLRLHIAQFPFMKVFDGGVMTHSKQYL